MIDFFHFESKSLLTVGSSGDQVLNAIAKQFIKIINGKEYKCYSIFYPVGNGRFNIDKSIENILWIRENILNSWKNFNNQLVNLAIFYWLCPII